MMTAGCLVRLIHKLDRSIRIRRYGVVAVEQCVERVGHVGVDFVVVVVVRVVIVIVMMMMMMVMVVVITVR